MVRPQRRPLASQRVSTAPLKIALILPWEAGYRLHYLAPALELAVAVA